MQQQKPSKHWLERNIKKNALSNRDRKLRHKISPVWKRWRILQYG